VKKRTLDKDIYGKKPGKNQPKKHGRKRYNWIVGINKPLKRVEVMISDPKNPAQASHLTSVRQIYATKVPIHVIREMESVMKVIIVLPD
jgi:hypothetical protein